MSTISAESQAERDQGVRDVVRTITLAGLITIAASAYDFVISGQQGQIPYVQLSQVAILIILLTAVIVASWLGLIASTRTTIGAIYGLLCLFLLSIVGDLLFVTKDPLAVERYTPWVMAALIIPFLTVGRFFARLLGGSFVAAMVLMIGAHIVRIGANPFTQPCCADLILFCLAMIVAIAALLAELASRVQTPLSDPKAIGTAATPPFLYHGHRQSTRDARHVANWQSMRSFDVPVARPAPAVD